MKKFFNYLLLLTVSLVMTAQFTSCSDEPSKNLKGNWYVYNLPSKGQDGTGEAYYFVNDDYLIYYHNVTGRKTWINSTALTGKMDGYYYETGFDKSYSYEVVDNKVYVVMQGKILTIDGDKLIRDGGGTFKKL